MPVCRRGSDSDCAAPEAPKGECDACAHRRTHSCTTLQCEALIRDCVSSPNSQYLSCLCPSVLSPGQPCLCWGTVTTTSRTSGPLQNATSSSHSCIQRWRTTRCIMPRPCTKPELILRPPRLPLLWTTPAVTPRFHFAPTTHTHTLLTGRVSKAKHLFFFISLSLTDAETSSLHQIL